MDENQDQPTPDDLPDGPTVWPVDVPSDEPAGQTPQQSGTELLNGMRDAFERLGKEVLSTAEDVSSGRRPVVPDGVRSSLADLASGLAALADGAARSLGEWSRTLESGSGAGSHADADLEPEPEPGPDAGPDPEPGAGRHSSPS